MGTEAIRLDELFRKGLAEGAEGYGTQESLSCFRASIVYLYLNEMIRAATAAKCLNLVPPGVERQIDSAYDPMWRIKAKEAVLHDTGINSRITDLEGLGEFMLPAWIIRHELWLSEQIPNIVKMGEVLYYLSDTEFYRGTLMAKRIENLDHPCEDFHYGEGYRKLHGRSGTRICLQKGWYKERYYCFDTERKCVCEYPYKLLGVLDHCPVFIKDGRLYYEEAGVALSLEEYSPHKDYEFYQKEMLVSPVMRMSGIILPYFLSKKGEMRLSKEEARRVIWKYLQGVSIRRIPSEKRELRMRLEKVPKTLTLEDVRGLYTIFAEEVEKDESVARVLEMTEILQSYIKPDQPADDILFLLCFCNDKMAERNERFPCRALYDRLCRIGTENEALRGIYYDAADGSFRRKLQDMLLYGHAEEEEEEKTDGMHRIRALLERKVGIFYVKDGQLEVEITPEEKVIMLSTYKLPENPDKKNGIVAYDVYSEKYYIRIPRSMRGLNQKEIEKKIRESFGFFMCGMIEIEIENEADFLEMS